MSNEYVGTPWFKLKKGGQILGINFLGLRSVSVKKSDLEHLFIAIEWDEGCLSLRCNLKGSRCIFFPALVTWPIRLKLVSQKPKELTVELCDIAIGVVTVSKQRMLDKWFQFVFENGEQGILERIEVHLQLSYTSALKVDEWGSKERPVALSVDDKLLIDVFNNSALIIPLAIYSTSSIMTADRDAEVLMLLLDLPTSSHFLRRLIHLDTSPMITQKVKERLLITDSQLLECMNSNISRFLRSYARIFLIDKIVEVFSPLVKDVIDVESTVEIDVIKEFMQRAATLIPSFSIDLIRVMADTFSDFSLASSRTACACVVVHCFAVCFLMPVEFGVLKSLPPPDKRRRMVAVWKKILSICLSFAELHSQGFSFLSDEMDGSQNSYKESGIFNEYMTNLEAATEVFLRKKPLTAVDTCSTSYHPHPSDALKLAACGVAKSLLKERMPFILKNETHGDHISMFLSRIKHLIENEGKNTHAGPIPPPPTESSAHLKELSENAALYEGSYSFREVAQRMEYLLMKSGQTSKRNLMRRNILKGMPIVSRLRQRLSTFISTKRPTLESLQISGALPMNYITQAFPEEFKPAPLSDPNYRVDFTPPASSTLDERLPSTRPTTISSLLPFSFSLNPPHIKLRPASMNGFERISKNDAQQSGVSRVGSVVGTRKSDELNDTTTAVVNEVSKQTSSDGSKRKEVDGRKCADGCDEATHGNTTVAFIGSTEFPQMSVNGGSSQQSNSDAVYAIASEYPPAEQQSKPTKLRTSSSAVDLLLAAHSHPPKVKPDLTEEALTRSLNENDGIKQTTTQTFLEQTSQKHVLSPPPPHHRNNVGMPTTGRDYTYNKSEVCRTTLESHDADISPNISNNDGLNAVINSLASSRLHENKSRHSMKNDRPVTLHSASTFSTVDEIQEQLKAVHEYATTLNNRLEETKYRGAVLGERDGGRTQLESSQTMRHGSRTKTFSPTLNSSATINGIHLSDQPPQASSPFLQVVNTFVRRQLLGKGKPIPTEHSTPHPMSATVLRKAVKGTKGQSQTIYT